MPSHAVIDGGYYCKTQENRPLVGPLPVAGAYMIGALSDAMRALAQSPELRHRLGASGRDKARAGYDWERKVDRMLELYAEVAHKQSARNVAE